MVIVLNGSADQSDFGAFVLGIGFRGATPRVIVMMASRATRYSAFEIVAKNAVFRGSLHFYSSILRMLVNKHKFSAVLMPAILLEAKAGTENFRRGSERRRRR